jgi:NADH-quinone oxidoreductase subunit M
VADPTNLALLLVLPAVAAALVGFLRPDAARAVAAIAMVAVLALALPAFVGFDGRPYAASLGEWTMLGIDLRFGVDGLNIYLLLLTALLFPVVLACAWTTAEGRSPLWLALVLSLQAGLLGTFLARNLVVLFVLWEAVLIPMVLLILVFGGEGRRRAAMGFFLYTMAGSVLFLAAVILLGAQSARETGRWSYDLATLYRLHLDEGRETFVFVAIALACAIKSPLFPFHAWLPRAYREASPTGTALMAGVMSKMGAYGFLALALPLCPTVAPRFAPLMVGLAVASILYGAVLALRQRQPKDLVAYASLSHMGYIVLGVFSLEATALQGALFQVLSHGVAVAGLFLMLGFLEQRLGGAWAGIDALATRAPRLAVVLMLFVLASLALPLTSGFTAEFLILQGAFARGLATIEAGGSTALLVAAVLACTGVVLGATYMLRFARPLLYGDAGTSAAPAVPDLRLRETLAMAVLLAVIVEVGVWPAPLMAKVESAVGRLAQPVAAGLAPPPVAAGAPTGGPR